jgi:hypothetical protein
MMNRKGNANLPCIHCGNLTKRRASWYRKGILKEPDKLVVCHREECRKRYKNRAI